MYDAQDKIIKKKRVHIFSKQKKKKANAFQFLESGAQTRLDLPIAIIAKGYHNLKGWSLVTRDSVRKSILLQNF